MIPEKHITGFISTRYYTGAIFPVAKDCPVVVDMEHTGYVYSTRRHRDPVGKTQVYVGDRIPEILEFLKTPPASTLDRIRISAGLHYWVSEDAGMPREKIKAAVASFVKFLEPLGHAGFLEGHDIYTEVVSPEAFVVFFSYRNKLLKFFAF